MAGGLTEGWRTAFTYAVMIVLSLLVLFPFYWMVMGSFMSDSEVTSYPIRLVPKRFHFENYTLYFLFTKLGEQNIRETLKVRHSGLEGDVLTWMRNTLYITALGWVGVVFVSAAAGYAFAKIDFWGRDVVFLILMSGMFMPWMVLLIPRYLFFRSLGWVDSFRPLYVPFLIGGGLLVIFLFRQHFRTIPNELVEAAQMDGASHLRIFLQLMMPLSKAPIAAVSVLFVMERWNDLIEPLLYLGGQSRMWTMSLALFNIVRQVGAADMGATPINLQMSGAVILVVPVLLLFFFAQRYFVQGLTQGSIK